MQLTTSLVKREQAAGATTRCDETEVEAKIKTLKTKMAGK